MKYRDGEYSPELFDQVDRYYENFPPDRGQVVVIGKNRIRIEYDSGKPSGEWVNPADCDLISREG